PSEDCAEPTKFLPVHRRIPLATSGVTAVEFRCRLMEASAAHACEPYWPLLSFAFRYKFAHFSPGSLVRTFGRTIHADHRSLPAPREARTGRHGNRLPRPRHAAPEGRRRQG